MTKRKVKNSDRWLKPYILTKHDSNCGARIIGAAKDFMEAQASAEQEAQASAEQMALRGDATYAVYKVQGYAEVGPVKWQCIDAPSAKAPEPELETIEVTIQVSPEVAAKIRSGELTGFSMAGGPIEEDTALEGDTD